MIKLTVINVIALLQVVDLKDVHNYFGTSKKSIEHFIYRSGLNPTKIKSDYAKSQLKSLSKKHTINEVIEITGFSRRKIMRHSADGDIIFKFSNKNRN